MHSQDNPWRAAAFAAGLLIVLAAWFGTRVFMFYNYTPMNHAMTKIFQDMGVSMNDGHAIGEINVSRVIRNKDLLYTEPYAARAMDTDVYCQFKTVDPGDGVVFAAARKLFFFMPDTVMRVVMLQEFLDALLVILLFATFYRWGWIPAVWAGVLYSAHSIFALAADTAWYHFWDGLVCALSVIILLWMYRFAESSERPRGILMTLALLLGMVLGAGVWLRSSWFIFAPVLFFATAFSKHVRPWLGYAVLIYALFAGAMVWRATALNGALSYSTRMSWHTAVQALGRYPNPYGFEDNDLYLFERAHAEHGLNYNLCDYAAQDRAMAQDYKALWHNNPGFIAQSIAQRMFSSFFSNFSDKNLPFWNHVMLLLAWLGLVCSLFARGDLRLFAVISALLYGLLNTAYSMVYYIHREYSYPTQMLLLFGSVVAIASMWQFVLRCWHHDWPRIDWRRPHPATLVLLISSAVMMLLFLPPVQNYLTPHVAMTSQWDAESGIRSSDYLALREAVNRLPLPQRTQFLAYARYHTTQKSEGPDEPVFQYAMQHLHHARFTNTDGSGGDFWFDESVDNDTYEALTRATKSIMGVGYQSIVAFDPADANTWGGRRLRFALMPNDVLAAERVTALLTEKFLAWNWQLKSLGNNVYMATHQERGCSEIRRQLAQYFNHQCGGSHDARADQPE